jgi:hypothetical protein
MCATDNSGSYGVMACDLFDFDLFMLSLLYEKNNCNVLKGEGRTLLSTEEHDRGAIYNDT